VTGSLQARVRTVGMLALAILLAAAAGCRRGIEVTGPTVEEEFESPPYLTEEYWRGEPGLEKVAGTGLLHMKEFDGKVLGPKYAICRLGKRWYWLYKDHWFSAAKWRGPWKPAEKVPAEFLAIPAGHALHRMAELHPEHK
jgi:hypothetical protein